MESSALEMTDGSATPPAESEPAPPVVTACRCVLCVVVLLAFGDCWCRSAIGCTPAIAGGTKSRPLTVSAAFGCGLVATIIDVIDALIPSPVILRARTVAILAAASACWCVAVVVLRTSLWREESCFGVLLGQIGRHVPVALVALLAVLAAGISSCRAIARWPMRGGLHLQEPDDEVTALLAAPGPSALLLSVLLSGCFAKADGALSPGETLCIIFAAILTGAAGCVATRFVVHAELANLPKAFGPEALCATLLVFATIFVWCGLRHWVSQPPGGAASGRRGGMWSNSNSSGLGASLLADESTDEEGGFKSRLPPTIMKPKANSKPDTASKVPEAQAAPSPSISESGSHHDGDFHHDEAQRLAGVSARGSRARPPRRRSRAENFRRRVDDRRHDDSTDASGDDDEDRHAAVDGDEDEDRRRMPPPEPRRPAAAPPTHPSADSIPANLTGTTQQNSMLSQSVEVLAGPSSEVQGGPGAVAAAAMELRRAYRSGRERKKRNAWEGALNAFGDALTLYQAAVNSGADFAGGIPLGGGFSSSVCVPDTAQKHRVVV